MCKVLRLIWSKRPRPGCKRCDFQWLCPACQAWNDRQQEE